ncbi:TNF receptor-associated factor 1 isoform X1 [Pogona vitticeps]
MSGFSRGNREARPVVSCCHLFRVGEPSDLAPDPSEGGPFLAPDRRTEGPGDPSPPRAMDRLAVDEKSGAPLRFARRLRRTAGRRRSFSADSSRSNAAGSPSQPPRGSRGPSGCSPSLCPEAPEPRSRCGRCQGGLRPATQCGGCGDRSCASCLAGIVRNEKMPLCLRCEEEDSVAAVGEEALLPVEKALTDAATDKQISELAVPCGILGCNWTGAMKTREDHRRTCEQALNPCHFGCGQLVMRKMLADHLRNGCAKAGLRSSCHQTDACSDHQNLAVVSFKEDGCRFSRIGCSFQGDAKDRESHEADALGVHLRLLLQHVKKLKACLHPAGDDVKESLTEGDVSTRIAFNPMPRGFVEGEFLSGLPLYEEGMPWRNLSRRTEGVSLLETKLHVFENIVSVLSKEMAASRQRFVAFRGQRGLDQDMIRGLELKIADLQRCLVQKDAALGKLEQRLHASGEASYNGVFLWKITDVHRKSYEAVCGKINSFHSPPFYTSRYGYKLCMRIYLNGEGSSKGSYLSVFLVLLKGDYDALLPWPFAHKMTLTLLDQNDGEHFANTIHPDPALASFQRPVGEMNEASGFSRFIPLTKLQSPKYAYIKEGTLFLRCVAHASS